MNFYVGKKREPGFCNNALLLAWASKPLAVFLTTSVAANLPLCQFASKTLEIMEYGPEGGQ